MLTARSVVAVTVGVALISIMLATISLLRPPDSGGLAGDSYGTRAHGYRAVLETLSELDVPVRRRLGPPLPPADQDHTLVFWAPHRNLVNLEPAYLEQVAGWVRGGGRVVVAPARIDSKPQQPIFLRPFAGDEETDILAQLGLPGVEVRPLEETGRGEGQGSSIQTDGEWGGPPPGHGREGTGRRDFGRLRETWDEVWSAEPVPTAPLSVKAHGALAELGQWVDAVELPRQGLQVLETTGAEPAGSVTFTDAEGVQRTLAAAYRVGGGEVVVVAEPALLENRLIARRDNSVLAAHLLAAGGREVTFEEFYHGLTIRGNPWWLLTRRGFAVMALCTLAVVGLWGWRHSVSLGPPPAHEGTSRRSIGEYVEAMARFLKRGRASDRFLLREVREGVLRSVRREVGLPPGREDVEDLAAVLARRDPPRAQELIEAVGRVDRILSAASRPREKQTLYAVRRIVDCLSSHVTKPSAVKSPR